MVFNLEAIIWYVFIIDSICANIMVWFSPSFVKWYKKKCPSFLKHIPLTKGWTFLYLIFVLWVGYALYRLGILPY